MKSVEIYIDGACSGNPGPIGFAAIYQGKNGVLGKSGYDSNPKCTNNQAELRAAIIGLSALKNPCKVTFYTDSQYVTNGYKHSEEWLTAEGRLNRELWMELISAVKNGKHEIRFVKVKGHANVQLNEIADKLAKAKCKEAKHQLLKEGY